MKTKVLISILLVFSMFTNYGQSPIQVTATGTCQPLTHQYNYNGIMNGKNDYIYNYYPPQVIFHISFDGTRWICYEQSNFNEISFFNTNVTSGLLPPNDGWQPDICNDGTLIISGGVSNIESFLVDKYKIYPNPVQNILKIQPDTFESIEIYNLQGILLIKSKNKKQINITNLKTGIYVVSIINKHKQKYNMLIQKH